MPERYDAIVVGLGAMGSAALDALARRGLNVLGLERFQPGHTMGSSHGESRIIRLAYFEHPDYVPLLRRSYEGWAALEADTQERLLLRTGGVFVGPESGVLVLGSLRSAREHDIPHEVLDSADLQRRFPALQPAPTDVALFEATAGTLLPERCIASFLRRAAAQGAEVRHQDGVLAWTRDGDGVAVRSASGTYLADGLVVTAGAWLGKLLHELGQLLKPERVPIAWIRPSGDAALFEPDRFPIYIWETPDIGFYYGFPHLERPGCKVGKHHTGEYVDPETADREVTDADLAPIQEFARRHIPGLSGPVEERRICLYTNSPDEHFVVDAHPADERVVFAGGFSGHGFKFAPAIGELLADLATSGRRDPSAAFLRLNRLGTAT